MTMTLEQAIKELDVVQRRAKARCLQETHLRQFERYYWHARVLARALGVDEDEVEVEDLGTFVANSYKYLAYSTGCKRTVEGWQVYRCTASNRPYGCGDSIRIRIPAPEDISTKEANDWLESLVPPGWGRARKYNDYLVW